MLEPLELDEAVIKELLYIKEVAQKKLFFRRVRIPPLRILYTWEACTNQFLNNLAYSTLPYAVGRQSNEKAA